MSAFLRGLMSTPETRRFHTIRQIMRLMQEERPGQVTDIIKHKNKFDRLILELPEVVPEAQVTAMMIHNLDTPHRDAMQLGKIPQTRKAFHEKALRVQTTNFHSAVVARYLRSRSCLPLLTMMFFPRCPPLGRLAHAAPLGIASSSACSVAHIPPRLVLTFAGSCCHCVCGIVGGSYYTFRPLNSASQRDAIPFALPAHSTHISPKTVYGIEWADNLL